MTAQEKLNKIDEMLYGYGMSQPGTVEKIMAIIEENKKYKRFHEENESTMSRAIFLLENGYLDD